VRRRVAKSENWVPFRVGPLFAKSGATDFKKVGLKPSLLLGCTRLRRALWMSALKRIADPSRTSRHVRFVPSSDSRTAAKRILLDHLGGAGEHGGGMVKPRFGIDIDHQLQFVRCRTEMVCKLFTFQTLRSAGLVYFVA
jgi:hypothetical protein